MADTTARQSDVVKVDVGGTKFHASQSIREGWPKKGALGGRAPMVAVVVADNSTTTILYISTLQQSQ